MRNNIICLLILLISFSCKVQENKIITKKYYNSSVGEVVIYGSILSNLDKNYVLLEEEFGTESFLNRYQASEIFLNSEKDLYFKTLKEIPRLPVSFVHHLLTYYEDKTDSYCQWIKRRNPGSSIIKDYEIVSKSEAAIILIDNYMLEFSDNFIISSYIKKLNFDNLKEFFKQKGNYNLSEMRLQYKQWVNNL